MFNYIKKIPDESIDCVITDCPYHIVTGGCKTKKNPVGGILSGENAQYGKLFENNDIHFSEWLPDVFRVLKKNTHCYIFINSRNLKELQMCAENVGFIFQNLLVWDKGNVTPNRYYMNGCEFILLLRKGKARTINFPGTSNIFKVKNILGKKLHETQKPVELMQNWITNSSNEGDLILDPFMGSGSTGEACINTNRNFIGIEIDPNCYDIAKARLKNKCQLLEEQNVT